MSGFIFDLAFAIAVCARQTVAVEQPMRIVAGTAVWSVMARAFGSSGANAIFVARALPVTTALRLPRLRTSQLHQAPFDVTVPVPLALRHIKEETVITRRALKCTHLGAARALRWNAIGTCAQYGVAANRVGCSCSIRLRG